MKKMAMNFVHEQAYLIIFDILTEPTSNTETNRFYENNSAENRLHQNVSTSQYEELIRGKL